MGRMTLGFTLIIIGIAFFLRNTGLIVLSWAVVWPLILVALGAYIVIVSRRITHWFGHLRSRIFK